MFREKLKNRLGIPSSSWDKELARFQGTSFAQVILANGKHYAIGMFQFCNMEYKHIIAMFLPLNQQFFDYNSKFSIDQIMLRTHHVVPHKMEPIYEARYFTVLSIVLKVIRIVEITKPPGKPKTKRNQGTGSSKRYVLNLEYVLIL